MCQVCFRPYGTNYNMLFTIFIDVSTTTTRTTHPQDGLKHASEPPTNLGAPGGHTATRARVHLVSTLRQTLVLLGSLLEAIKGGVQGFQVDWRGTTLHRFSPSTTDIGNCLNHLQRLGIHFLSRLACTPYYKHLDAR